MPEVRGSELPVHIQKECLSRFVYRFTGEHKPQWAYKVWKHENGQACNYPVQFKDDADWLANTLFQVTAKGQLSNKHEYCHSTPTWPFNPELRQSK